MTDTRDTIKYKPYRGVLEPTGEVRKAEINLYPNYLETISSYDHGLYLPDEDEVPYKKSAVTFPKSLILLELTEAWHCRDMEKRASPVITIFCGNQSETIYVETEKEAYEIYSKIKKWLLNE